jgi:uncharacterized protein (DUF302 family)
VLFEEQCNSLRIPNDHTRRGFIKQAVAICFYNILPFKNIIMTNPTGVTIRKSPYTVKETIDRLQAALEQHQVTIYARINQEQELQKVGQVIPPLEFLLFGSPKVGGPVMIENPLAALDLPLKAIAWQDEQQTVHIAYNDASYIKSRYALSEAVSTPLSLDPLITKILS